MLDMEHDCMEHLVDNHPDMLVEHVMDSNLAVVMEWIAKHHSKEMIDMLKKHGNLGDLDVEEDLPYKFECGDCGCYYWVNDRDNFECPNCQDKVGESRS